MPFLLWLLPQTENVFPSTHFPLLETDLGNTKDAQEKEGACSLKTPLQILYPGALSWCINHVLFFHKFSLIFLTLSLSLIRTCLYYACLTAWPTGTHLIMITPKRIGIAFSFDFLIFFFIPGDVGVHRLTLCFWVLLADPCFITYMWASLVVWTSEQMS